MNFVLRVDNGGTHFLHRDDVARRAGVSRPVLSFGGFWEGQAEACVARGIVPVVYRLDMAAGLDAARDAGNRWVFPEAGPPCQEIRDIYVAGTGAPTHFVDVTDTIDLGVASLREHRAYIEGLGREFDPDEFLKNMAGYVGLGAGCDYAVGFRRYPMG